LLALHLVHVPLLPTLPLAAKVVEESLARDPGPLDFIQGDSYEQWILQSLAGECLVGPRKGCPRDGAVPALRLGFRP